MQSQHTPETKKATSKEQSTCIHTRVEKETAKGTHMPDYVCKDCGMIFTPVEKEKMEAKRKNLAFSAKSNMSEKERIVEARTSQSPFANTEQKHFKVTENVDYEVLDEIKY